MSGLGDLVTTTAKDHGYQHEFFGTEAAASMVGASVVLLQSVARARALGKLGNIDPYEMRKVLYDSGSNIPNPDKKYIGRQPDLVRALGLLDPSLGPVRKRKKSVFDT